MMTDYDDSNLDEDSEEVGIINTQREIETNSFRERIITEIVSTEANYERYSQFLFPHTKAADLKEVREKEIDVEIDGERKSASIVIRPGKDLKGYTTKSYDVYLALTQIWFDLIQPVGDWQFYFSDVCRKMGLKINGRNIKMIKEELDTLYYTNVSWKFSFELQDEIQEHLRNRRVLEKCDYVSLKDRLPGSKTSIKCTVKWADHISDNLRSNITIPVNVKARNSIKSQIAKSLYNRLDNILSKHKVHKRKVSNLVIDLNSSTKRYRTKSQLKEFADMLIKHLNGVELSKLGTFINVDIKPTRNNIDWTLIFSTYKEGGKLSKKAPRNIPILNTNPAEVDDLVEMIISKVGHAQQNKGFYYELARSYSRTLIQRSLGEFLELTQIQKIDNKPAYFTAVIHGIAHKMGKEWIKPCGVNCRYRPENFVI